MYITSPTGELAKKTTVIFVNDRLVSCSCIEKALSTTVKNVILSMHNGVWQQVASYKGGFFAYVALKMPKINVDINIHPTKKTV